MLRFNSGPVSVTLHFVPEGHALLLLVASLLRRPPAELAADLLHDDARVFSSDMKEAAKTGGFDNRHELVDNVKRRMEAEFEARRDRLHREQDKDAWQWTYLDKYRPSRFPGSTAYQSLIRKGGEA